MMLGRLAGVAASPFGIFAVLLGFVMFFAIPLLGAATRIQGPSRFMFWLASRPVSRAALVISESNDAVFKTMSFAEPGVERISFGDEEKSFDDPDGALHWWRGMRFALADEADGVLFDPRHAAIGAAKRLYDQREEAVFEATDNEALSWGIRKWIPAIFELPDRHQILDLSSVRELVDGGERAEYPQRVESFYRHSQDPFSDGASMMKFLYPVIGFSIPFFGMWILASQIGSTSRNVSSVSFGMIGVLLALGGGPDIGWGTIWKHIVGFLRMFVLLLVVIGVPISGFIGLWQVAGPAAAVGLYLCFFAGFLFLPGLSFLFSVSSGAALILAQLFFKLGFLGYRQPVLEWTPWSYRLREKANLDDPEDICWYGLFGSQVGVTYAPDADVWDDGERLPAENVRELAGPAVADSGEVATNIPPQYQPAPTVKRDIYGGFVPTHVDDEATYLDSAVALSRFSNSADGKMSMERLLLAKEKWGGDSSVLDDKTIAYLTAAGGLLGVILGVVFFVV